MRSQSAEHGEAIRSSIGRTIYSWNGRVKRSCVVSFAPLGLVYTRPPTQACALGCILAPLRGWSDRNVRPTRVGVAPSSRAMHFVGGIWDTQGCTFGDYILPYILWHNVSHVGNSSADRGMAWGTGSANGAGAAGDHRGAAADHLGQAAAGAGDHPGGGGRAGDSAADVAASAVAAREVDGG